MKTLIRGIQLARLAGITRGQITNEVRRGNLVKNLDKKYDLENPVNKDWCKNRDIKESDIIEIVKSNIKKKIQSKKSKQPPVKKERKKVINVKTKVKSKKIVKTKIIPQEKEEKDESKVAEYGFENISGLPDKYRNMTLEAIMLQFGSIQGFKMHVDILDKLFSAMKKDVEVKEKRNELIPKNLIKHLKTYVDDFMNKVFDYSETCIIEIIPLVQTDPEKAKAKIPILIKKNISKYANETVRNIDRRIKDLKKGEYLDASDTERS